MPDDGPEHVGERSDEQYWRDFRARARKRAGSQALLLIGPAIIAIAVLKLLSPTEYPVGDIRNSLEWRLVVYGAFIVFAVVLITVAARWLWSDRQGRR